MKYRQTLVVFLFISLTHWAVAEPNGEAREPSLEALDAAYTEADALRDAAKWSDEEIEYREPDPFADMSAEADLIIQATVISQSNSYSASGIPLTHTTLAISDLIKGDYTANEITVTELGGPSKRNPDSVIIMSHTHYFAVGDEEILFLKLNPAHSEEARRIKINHRFGVHQGKVFDENGRGLIYTVSENAPGYTLAQSKDRNPHPRFRDFQIGTKKYSKKFKEDKDSVDHGGDSQSPLGHPGNRRHQRSMAVSAFRSAVTK